MNKRRRLIFVAICAFFASSRIPLHAQSRESLEDAERRRAFLDSQKESIRAVGQVSRTIRARAPRSPFGDFSEILKWGDWAERNVERATRGETLEPPPVGLCSGFSVPAQRVQRFMDEVLSAHSSNTYLPNYGATYTLDLLERRQAIRTHFSSLVEHINTDEGFEESKNTLSALKAEIEGYLTYYSLLDAVLQRLVEAPVYFVAREALLCWFSLESSIIPSLEILRDSAENHIKRIELKKIERVQFISDWIAEHELALEVEQSDLEIALLEFEAGEEELEHIKQTAKDLAQERTDLKKAQDIAKATLEAAQLDRRNLSDVTASFSGRKIGLEREISRTSLFLRTPFDRCPNGNAYSECSHDAIKASWDRQMYDARSRLTSLQNELRSISDQIAQGQGNLRALDQAIIAYENEVEILDNDLRVVDADIEALFSQLLEDFSIGGLSEQDIMGLHSESSLESASLESLK